MNVNSRINQQQMNQDRSLAQRKNIYGAELGIIDPSLSYEQQLVMDNAHRRFCFF